MAPFPHAVLLPRTIVKRELPTPAIVGLIIIPVFVVASITSMILLFRCNRNRNRQFLSGASGIQSFALHQQGHGKYSSLSSSHHGLAYDPAFGHLHGHHHGHRGLDDQIPPPAYDPSMGGIGGLHGFSSDPLHTSNYSGGGFGGTSSGDGGASMGGNTGGGGNSSSL